MSPFGGEVRGFAVWLRPRRVLVPHSLREQEGMRTSSARAGGDGSVPRGAGGLGDIRGLGGSRGTVGAAVLRAGGRGVPAVWGAVARLRARALRRLRPRRRRGVLLQGAWLLPVVRGSAHGGHGGVAVRRGDPGSAGAAVGAVAAVSGADAVCVRHRGLRAGAWADGARGVRLLRANGEALGRAAAAGRCCGVRAALRFGAAAERALPRAVARWGVRLGAWPGSAGISRASGGERRRRAAVGASDL